MGYIDGPSGEWKYEAADAVAGVPVHDVLNRAQNASIVARTADRTKIAALEQSAPVVAPLPSPASGNTRDGSTVMMRVGALVFLTLKLTRSNEFPAGGTVFATLPAGYRPAADITVNGVSSVGGAATTHVIVIGANGDIRNWTSAPGNRILELSTFWSAAS